MHHEPHYFFFPPLGKILAREQLPQLSDGEFEKTYENWLQWYIHNSHLFHRDELNRHWDALFERFVQSRKLPKGFELGGSGKEEEFERYLDKNGYTKHEELYNDWRDTVAALEEEPKASLIGNIASDIFLKMIDRSQGKQPPSQVLIPAWFNSLVQNGPDKQTVLRSLPYEEYLKTPHWYYVRGLTTLVFRAQCIGRNCETLGDGLWSDDAPYRHVHHISYENRGNERFGDVCILCDRCHRSLHNEGKAILDESSIRDYLNSIWL